MMRKDKIIEILKTKIHVDHIEIIDESHKHEDHNPQAKSGGTHMQLLIVSKDFEGKNLVARHKMIYKILEAEFQSGLHALAIRTLTPDEIKAQSI